MSGTGSEIGTLQFGIHRTWDLNFASCRCQADDCRGLLEDMGSIFLSGLKVGNGIRSLVRTHARICCCGSYSCAHGFGDTSCGVLPQLKKHK